jgi:hypothetical protein
MHPRPRARQFRHGFFRRLLGPAVPHRRHGADLGFGRSKTLTWVSVCADKHMAATATPLLAWARGDGTTYLLYATVKLVMMHRCRYKRLYTSQTHSSSYQDCE